MKLHKEKIGSKLEISYNESKEAVAAYLYIRESHVVKTKEIIEGIVFADYNENGEIVGIEFLL